MSDLGNKEIFAKNLRYYMEKNKKDRNDICNILGFKYSTFSDWYNGNKYPRIDKVEMLANFFNIEKSDLIENKAKTKFKTDKFGNQIISIPLLGTVKAGCDYLSEENWIGTIDVDRELAKIGELFALKVHDDSMYPALIEDDFVIIKKQDDFETGDIVVVLINSEEAIIRKGKKTTNGIFLQAFNTNYEPIIYTYDEVKTIPVTIIGIVKQLKREF